MVEADERKHRIEREVENLRELGKNDPREAVAGWSRIEDVQRSARVPLRVRVCPFLHLDFVPTAGFLAQVEGWAREVGPLDQTVSNLSAIHAQQGRDVIEGEKWFHVSPSRHGESSALLELRQHPRNQFLECIAPMSGR